MYFFLVIEDEICCGIINVVCFFKYCFWFKRVILDFVENIDGNDVGKFIDKIWGVNFFIDEIV